MTGALVEKGSFPLFHWRRRPRRRILPRLLPLQTAHKGDACTVADKVPAAVAVGGGCGVSPSERERERAQSILELYSLYKQVYKLVAQQVVANTDIQALRHDLLYTTGAPSTQLLRLYVRNKYVGYVELELCSYTTPGVIHSHREARRQR